MDNKEMEKKELNLEELVNEQMKTAQETVQLPLEKLY